MALIPDEIIADVLARTDIISTVGRYVSLKKAGSNFKGLCPFHSEKTPSFNVHPAKGIFKCFGCGKGGNAIGFLMEIEGWSFPETVRHLAKHHGIEIPDLRDEKHEERERGRKVYLDIMNRARKFFEGNLWSDAGRAAQFYLKERDIDEETARSFGLGYAPDSWDSLLNHLGRDDIPASWAAKAGLVLPRKSGSGFYDRFRHRITFPIVDIWNNTLAFGGRVISPEDEPKYINSPETPYYVKGNHLYGLAASKNDIQKAEYAVLVEGNFDVISLHAHGVKNVIAMMGTALTDTQTKLLSRYCKKIVLAFDGDAAGEKAAVRSLGAIESAGLDARIVAFDEKDDPDTFVRRSGLAALEERINAAPALLDWGISLYLPKGERGDVREQIRALERVGEMMAEVKSTVVRERYVSEISRRLGIEPPLLNEYIRRPDAAGSKIRRAVSVTQNPHRLPKAEFGILVSLLDRPEWLDEFLSEQYDNLLSSSELISFLHQAHGSIQEREELNAAFLVEQIGSTFRTVVEEALLQRDDFFNDETARRFFEECIRTIKRDWADRTLKEIVARMEQVDFTIDRERFSELADQKKQVEQFKLSIDS